MNLKTIVLIFVCTFVNSCAGLPRQESPQPQQSNNTAIVSSGGNAASINSQQAENSATVASSTQSSQPKTVRDFFMLLPEKYFTLEGCDREKDKGCKKARVEYLKNLGEVEDTANGYLKGGCDGGQSCIEMALFKRPDGTYLIGVATWGEMIYDHYFLDYKDGIWTDVSSKVMPEFSKKNVYELPRYGTTVKVFAKKIIEQGDDWEISEKGAKLYDMEWKDGKFTKK